LIDAACGASPGKEISGLNSKISRFLCPQGDSNHCFGFERITFRVDYLLGILTMPHYPPGQLVDELLMLVFPMNGNQFLVISNVFGLLSARACLLMVDVSKKKNYPPGL
jgi:hypothetical protein